MDLVTLVVFIVFFLIAGVSVFLISIYGTSEQSFEDGLIKSTEKKKERKAGNPSKKEDDTSSGLHQRKKSAKAGKKLASDEEEVAEPVPVAKKDVAKPKEVQRPDPTAAVKKDKAQPAPAAAAATKPKEEVKSAVVVPKPEEPIVAAAKKPVVKEEKRNSGAKSKILIEEVESDVVKAATVVATAAPVDEPTKAAELVKPKQMKVVEKPQDHSKVEEIIPVKMEVVQQVPAKEVSQAKPSKKKADVASTNKNVSEKFSDPGAFISAVRHVNFDERQVQQLIDILLNKQNAGDGKSLNGFDRGDEWSGDKATSNMKRQLTEVQSALDEERGKTKSLTDRMAVLRTELNQTKSAQVAAQRLVEEAQSRNQQSVAQYEHRLKQEIDARHHLQTQFNVQLNHAQQLQQALESIQKQQSQQQANAGALEQLTEAKAAYEAELANVKNQLGQTMAQLAEANEAKRQAATDLTAAKQEASQKAAILEKEISQGKTRIADLERVNKEFEAKIATLNTSLKALESEKASLTEENKRLSEQPKSVPASKSEIVPTAANASTTATIDKSVYLKETSSLTKKWAEIFKTEDFSTRPTLLDVYTSEALVNGSVVNGQGPDSDKKFKLEKTLAQGDAMLSSLVECCTSLKSKLSAAEAEIVNHKSKNNELREKNWKVVEALNSAEEKLRKHQTSSSSQPSVQQDTQKLKQAVQDEVRASIQSHFSDVNVVPEEKSFDVWIKKFVEQIEAKIQTTSTVADSKDETEALQKQINHYKAILSETEHTLHKLQMEVESMDSDHESKICELKESLASTEKSVEDLKSEKAVLAKKSADLQSQLEESNKKIEELSKQSSSAIIDTAELEKLKSELSSEQKRNEELNQQVTRLNVMVSTSQKALEQEKRISEMMKSQSQGEKSADSVSLVSSTLENGNEKSPQCEEKNAA